MKNSLVAFCVALCLISLTAVFFDLLFPIRYYGYVKKYCNMYGVEQSTALAVIWTESKFQKDAVSSAGAQGLMQLMPSTAKWLLERQGKDYRIGMLFEPEINVQLGVYYLSYLQGKFEGNYVLAAYNAGEGNVKAWLSYGGEVKFAETQDYIKKVNAVKKLYAIRIFNQR